MTRDEILETIKREEISVGSLMEIIEQYILDRKGKIIKVRHPGNNIMEVQRMLTAYTYNILPWYTLELFKNKLE